MNDQPAYVTREEFERRMRVLEGEVEGEKAVSRHILEQTRRNGDYLTAMRSEFGALESRVDHLAGEVALIKGVLSSHTALLNVLVQDVGQIRTLLTRRDPPQG
jgi:hypothetical protein